MFETGNYKFRAATDQDSEELLSGFHGLDRFKKPNVKADIPSIAMTHRNNGHIDFKVMIETLDTAVFEVETYFTHTEKRIYGVTEDLDTLPTAINRHINAVLDGDYCGYLEQPVWIVWAKSGMPIGLASYMIGEVKTKELPERNNK